MKVHINMIFNYFIIVYLSFNDVVDVKRHDTRSLIIELRIYKKCFQEYNT